MSTPIRAALVPGSALLPAVQDGIRALKREHLSHLEDDVRGLFADSADIDAAFERGHEQENRWDYLLGHEATGQVFGLEPHTANNHEVSTVLKKRARALEHLALHLRKGVRIADWFWVASGKVDFQPMEKAMFRLASGGVKFVGKRLLKGHLPAEDAPSGGRKKTRPKRRAKP